MNKFFLNLGVQPLANNFLTKFSSKQPKYNLKLYFNTKSKIVSISKRIPSSVMFNSKYPYRSSMSSTMRSSFRQLSNEIKKKFNPKMLLEIGSNDGALLTHFDKDRAIGVEPCKNLAKITKAKRYYTYDNYWDLELSSKIKKKFNEVDLIFSANTLTHISKLNEVFKSINLILSDEGVLIIEDPSLLECIKNNAYDQFYNEHIYVFSAIALKNLLKKFDLEIFDVKNLPTHGGSLRYFIKKRSNKKYNVKLSVKKQIDKEIKNGLDRFITYKNFAIKSTKSKKLLLEMLKKIKKDNKKIIGYGATAKAVTVLNYCKIDHDLIKNFTDTTPEKINTFVPGKNIKILGYKKDILKKYDYVFLGAWNFKKEIFKKEKTYINNGGKFITHVPYPKII
jgi:SAM-dependent methyltransferase